MGKLFDSTNDYYQIIGGSNAYRSVDGRSVLGVREGGICMAITALWCRNLLDGQVKQPDAFRAQLIQARSRIRFARPDSDRDVEAFFDELFALTEVTAHRVYDSKGALLCLHGMLSSPGIYWVWNGPHVIGFKTALRDYLFYDCDENGAGGLWQFDDADAWMQKVFEFYDRNEQWSVWRVTA